MFGLGTLVRRMLGETPAGPKRSFPARLPEEVSNEIERLLDEGLSPEDIVDELAEQGFTVSEKTVRRRRNARIPKGNGAAKTIPEEWRAEVRQLLEKGMEVDDVVAEMAERGHPVPETTVVRWQKTLQNPAPSPSTVIVQSSGGRSGDESADDLIEDIRYRATKQLQNDPQVVQAVAVSIKNDLLQSLGAAPGAGKSTWETLADEADAAERFLNRVRPSSGGGDNSLRSVLLGVGKEALAPLLADMAEEFVMSRRQARAAARIAPPPPGQLPAPQPPSQPSVATQPPLMEVPPPAPETPMSDGVLLGVFFREDVERLLAFDDAEDAANEAMTLVEERLKDVDESVARTVAFQVFSFGHADWDADIEPELHPFAEKYPDWQPVITALLAKPAAWRDEFRQALAEFITQSPEPEGEKAEGAA